MTSMLASSRIEIAKFDGGAAKHVGQHDDTTAGFGLADRVDNVLAAAFHIVVGADANRFDQFLRADDVLERRHEFNGKPAMG